jgi:endonuclease III
VYLLMPADCFPCPIPHAALSELRYAARCLWQLRYLGPVLMPEAETAVVTPVHTVTPPRRVPKPKNAAERKARLNRIFSELDKIFPAATCALHHSNAWQLLVATILSAQCTDERVNKVTPGLFDKYPTIKDMANASQEELANEIRSTGFFNNKSRSLIGAAKKILSDFHGEVPRTMEELLAVPGAARKTANVVLGTAYGIASGIVVDTHVQRIAFRLDLTKQEDPNKIEQDLMKIVPRERWVLFSHQVIHFGRQICIARKPRCASCPLDPLCYAKDKTLA